MICQICGKDNLKNFLSLGHQPPSDAFLTEEKLNIPEITYPLDVYFCPDCLLVQLGYAVSPEILFKDYVYNTGSNNSLKKNFEGLVNLLVEKFSLTRKDLAVDIGSNDGTLLSYYQPFSIGVLGIDPSSVAKMAIARGIPTVNDFFNSQTAESAAKKYGKAKAITSTNTFAHVEALDSFMKGVKKILSQDGVFVTESHYLLDLIEKMQYDAIYHEHLRYYSLLSMQNLFKRYGMEIFDAERIGTHGGSIRVFAARKGAHKISTNVKILMTAEKKAGLDLEKTFHSFANRVESIRFNLSKLLLDIKGKGKRIVGLGAPAKGNTMLNYCRLDSGLIDYLAEKSDLKIGLFSPGTHIPVLSETKINEEQPDYLLVLSWNIADELIPKLRAAGFKGKFILPNPEVKIIDQ